MPRYRHRRQRVGYASSFLTALTIRLRWRVPELARRRFKLSGNSLAVLSQFFQTRKKTPLVPEDWLLAALARDEKAMRRIEKHCQADVIALSSLVPFFRGLWGQRVSDGVFF